MPVSAVSIGGVCVKFCLGTPWFDAILFWSASIGAALILMLNLFYGLAALILDTPEFLMPVLNYEELILFIFGSLFYVFIFIL